MPDTPCPPPSRPSNHFFGASLAAAAAQELSLWRRGSKLWAAAGRSKGRAEAGGFSLAVRPAGRAGEEGEGGGRRKEAKPPAAASHKEKRTRTHTRGRAHRQPEARSASKAKAASVLLSLGTSGGGGGCYRCSGRLESEGGKRESGRACRNRLAGIRAAVPRHSWGRTKKGTDFAGEGSLRNRKRSYIPRRSRYPHPPGF